jgi:PKD repeat protein
VAIAGGIPPFSFLWSNSDTSQNLNNVTPGTYSLVITDSTGCKSYDTAVITAFGTQPVAFFELNDSTGCTPLTVNFTDLSTNNPTGWTWSFGDGSPLSHVQNPEHIYIVGGTFIVTETATNASGSSTYSSTILAFASPVSSVQVVDINAAIPGSEGGAAVAVTGGALPYTFVWSNGDSTQNLTGVLQGIYYLVISDSNGCESYDTAVITVTGLSDIYGNDLRIRIYPDPAFDETNIASAGFITGKPFIRLTDIAGKQVQINSEYNGSVITLNTSGLASGMYLITITLNGQTASAKFVKE